MENKEQLNPENPNHTSGEEHPAGKPVENSKAEKKSSPEDKQEEKLPAGPQSEEKQAAEPQSEEKQPAEPVAKAGKEDAATDGSRDSASTLKAEKDQSGETDTVDQEAIAADKAKEGAEGQVEPPEQEKTEAAEKQNEAAGGEQEETAKGEKEETAKGEKEEVAKSEQEETAKGEKEEAAKSEQEEADKGDQEEDSEELAAQYAAMGREELVQKIEDLVGNEDVAYIRKHIGFIKASYRKLLRDENMAVYEQRLGSEDSPEDKEIPVDSLTERFDAAFAVYREKKTAHDKALEKEMQLNLQTKEAILEELRELIDSEEELKKTYDQFHALQERWRSVGPVPRGAKGTLWNNYHFLVEKFFDKVNINKELKDLDLKKNLETKTELCEKAEELLLETNITKSFQQLQKLHEAWKETGPVPKDKKDELWDRFKAATDKLNKRRQEHYESLREEQNKNYAAKLVLCEKAEELVTNLPETPKKWQQKTDEINELFKVWKTIGFAPKKVNNEIWNRFRSSLDSFFSGKKEFFKKYKDQQKDNYNQKLNLCLQAEALKDSEDWRATTESLIALQKEWKQIGPVPAKFSDKIWKRFRDACDTFFNKKSNHFANIGEKQEENLSKKQDLIAKIKNAAYGDDNKENLDILKDFQRQWMEIGHVPIKHKDKIQGEFRKAIDEQFEKLNISKKAKSTLSFRSKIESLKSAPNAGNIIQKERNFLSSRIKTLEGDIKVLENNIGFFASSKKADVLKAEFEEKIDKARNEISVLKEKMRILSDS